MANQPEAAVYDSGVLQLELSTPVQGGVGGASNAPLLNLANRTAYLKQHVDNLETNAAGLAPVNSPTFTGTPTTPTPALGDSSQKIPSTAWVQNTIGGILSKSVAGNANVTLTTVEAGNGILVFTGALTGNIAVIVPNVSKYWVVANRTTGNFSLTVKTAAGSGVVIPSSLAVVVYCDTTNVALASSSGQASFTPYLFSPAAGTTLLSISGGYTPGCVMVEKNGALLRTSVYTATNGATIVIPATVAGDQFTVYAFSSFSVANAVQKSGDTMAGPLGLAAGSTVPTPALFDSSTRLPTTFSVQRSLGSFNTTNSLNTTTTLTTDNIGNVVECFGMTPYVVTLPPLASVPNGGAITLRSTNNGVTIKCNGSEMLSYGAGSANSIIINDGENLLLVSNGGSGWIVAGGSGSLKYAYGFSSIIAASGSQRLPSGMIEQWGQVVSNSSGIAVVTFPIAFPNGPVSFMATEFNSGNGTVTMTQPTNTGAQLNFWQPQVGSVPSPAGITAQWNAKGY